MPNQLSRRIRCPDCNGVLFHVEDWNGEWFVTCKHCNTTLGTMQKGGVEKEEDTR